MTAIQTFLLRAMTVSSVVVAAAAAAATTRNTNESFASSSSGTVGIERHLQQTFQPMAGYTPKSLVTDVASLDLDLEVLKNTLDTIDESVINTAARIYELGGHAESFADVTINGSGRLKKTARAGTRVDGVDANGNPVIGTIVGNIATGSRDINIKYQPSPVQANYLACTVGALVLVDQADTSGCFAQSGQVQIADDSTYSYRYNVTGENQNLLSLGSVSADRFPEEITQYPTLDKYEKYYENVKYGDVWIRAAFQAGVTDLKRGQASFSNMNVEGRVAGILDAIVVLNVWGEVVREMEVAIDLCAKNVDGQENWDRSAALYIGSKEGTTGDDRGLFLHQLADDLCMEFRTCSSNGRSAAGLAYVNEKVLETLDVGKTFFQDRQCDNLKVARTAVVGHMTVPLIQGLLKHVYMRSAGVNTDVVAAKSAAYAAAIVPLLYDCDPESASIVMTNSGVGATNIDFGLVKSTIESQYKCLGVTCNRVGGFTEEDSTNYRPGAAKCFDSVRDPSFPTPGPTVAKREDSPDDRQADITKSPAAAPTVDGQPLSNNNDDNTAIVAGSVSGVLAFIILVLIVLFCCVRRNREADPVSKGNAPEFKDGEEITDMT